MPFDATARKSRIAIIGGGVSGLAAAYELAGQHDVTIFEAADDLGGHARTVMAGHNGDIPVDTGFIVYNKVNYPELTRMLGELGVAEKPSHMSFGASIGGGRIEYALHSGQAITAQKSNLLNPRFWRMLRDIVRFHKRALGTATNPDMSLAELLDELNLGSWFRDYYLLPMSGAIWSSTPEQMERFPARSLVQFFNNHALLTRNSHQWFTVDGGSVEYVRRIAAAIRKSGGRIHTGTPVLAVQREPFQQRVLLRDGTVKSFDQVIFACHSDQALQLIENPTQQERSILGRIRFQDNTAVLHADSGQMPLRRKAWASWVYRTDGKTPDARIGITYWMNSLQGIDTREPLFVSLNPTGPIRDDLVFDEVTFAHPVFDRATLAAQADLGSIQGENGTWFCGAWTRHGFHEDGYASGARIAREIADRTERPRLVA